MVWLMVAQREVFARHLVRALYYATLGALTHNRKPYLWSRGA